jgi:hypothetical protein
MGRQLADPGLAEARMLAVDAYLAQHPGEPSRQASQSVWVHLIGLCLALEHGYGGIASAKAKSRAAAPEATFEWLDPPDSLGLTTVLDVLATATPDEHRAAVRRWAVSVWEAWGAHHGAIRTRAEGLLRGNHGP